MYGNCELQSDFRTESPTGPISSAKNFRPDFLFNNDEDIGHNPPKLFTPVDLSPEKDELLRPPRKPSSHGSTRNIHSRGPRYSIPQTVERTPPSRRRRSVERVTFRPGSKDSIISRRSYSVFFFMFKTVFSLRIVEAVVQISLWRRRIWLFRLP